MPINWVALIVFVAFFGFVTFLGFAAAHWRRGDLDLLHEWGLAGGRFGTLITWFLLGGDVYTAYTFIAVPALAFGSGALAFFAVPYTIIVYPFVFMVFPRLWSVAKRHGYITAADFVRGRYGNKWLALAVALTGIVATMPYIALQLVGIQVVIAAMGIESTGWFGDLPLVIAFVVLAAFTYTSGLRAPAAIAIVKDLMIYITVAAVVIIVPLQLGGYAKIFGAVPPQKLILPPPPPGSLGAYSTYATLALGSALALFLYPHTITGVLSSSSRHVIRRNAALLPAYTFLLGLNQFPAWFVGFAFAAIGIGALVPAAIMSIAASNLWTRNIYKEFFNPSCTPKQEAQMAKWVSLIVKFGALVFVLGLSSQYAIYLQLLGGVWIIQTLPAVVLGLYTRWLNQWALLIGWAAGIVSGTWMAASVNFAAAFPLRIGGLTAPGYIAVWTLILNLIVTVVLTAIFTALGAAKPRDETAAADYV